MAGLNFIDYVKNHDYMTFHVTNIASIKNEVFFIQVADLRTVKGRYDDLMLIVDLNLKTNDVLLLA